MAPSIPVAGREAAHDGMIPWPSSHRPRVNENTPRERKSGSARRAALAGSGHRFDIEATRAEGRAKDVGAPAGAKEEGRNRKGRPAAAIVVVP